MKEFTDITAENYKNFIWKSRTIRIRLSSDTAVKISKIDAMMINADKGLELGGFYSNVDNTLYIEVNRVRKPDI